MNSTRPISLEVIRIENPCPASWDAMRGDDRVRFCDDCKLHVYNLSAMTRGAAEQLLAERAGRLCVQVYRRKDGTVITADCGGGLRAVAERAARRAGALAALALCAMLSPLVIRTETRSTRATAGAFQPTEWVRAAIDHLMRFAEINRTRGEVSVQPPMAGGISLPEHIEMGDVAVPQSTVTEPPRESPR